MKNILLFVILLSIFSCKEKGIKVKYPSDYLIYENEKISRGVLSFDTTDLVIFNFDAGCNSCQEKLQVFNQSLNNMSYKYPDKILVIANTPDTCVFKSLIKEFHIEYPILVDQYNEFRYFNRKEVVKSSSFYKVGGNGEFEWFKDNCDLEEILDNN